MRVSVRPPLPALTTAAVTIAVVLGKRTVLRRSARSAFPRPHVSALDAAAEATDMRILGQAEEHLRRCWEQLAPLYPDPPAN
jgi:hypothetical protein